MDPSDMPPVAACYNGAMLGYFLSGAAARYARPQFDLLHGRMAQFLEEIDVLPVLSDAPLEGEAAANQMKQALFMVGQSAPGVARWAHLSALTFHAVALRGVDDAGAGACADQARDMLQDLDTPATALDDFLKAVEPVGDRLDADVLHSAGLNFLRALLQPLPPDDTAFVVMPFAPPHDRLFQTLYRPVLARQDLYGIRAWGGLAHERYQPILHSLIGKSAAVLADLTGANPNVLHECGVAEGMGKPLFLIVDHRSDLPPTNLLDLMILDYDAEAPNVIDHLAGMIALGRLGAELET